MADVLDSFDVRVRDALTLLSGKERRAMTRAPFRVSLESITDELGSDESVQALTCAISSSLGRGVLALTDRRLVFCCTRSGAASWGLGEIRAVDGRSARFTLSAAITLHFDDRRQVFALSHARGSEFVDAVHAAVPDVVAA